MLASTTCQRGSWANTTLQNELAQFLQGIVHVRGQLGCSNPLLYLWILSIFEVLSPTCYPENNSMSEGGITAPRWLMDKIKLSTIYLSTIPWVPNSEKNLAPMSVILRSHVTAGGNWRETLKTFFIFMGLMSREVRSQKKKESWCVVVWDGDPESLPYEVFKEKENSVRWQTVVGFP